MTLVTSGTCAAVQVTFTEMSAVSRTLCLQQVRHVLQIDHPHDITTFNRGLWHAENNACFLTLGYCQSTGRPHFAHTRGTVLAHAGHEDCHRLGSKLLSHTSKENVCGWAMPVDRIVFVKDGHVAERQLLDLHVAIARANQRASCYP